MKIETRAAYLQPLQTVLDRFREGVIDQTEAAALLDGLGHSEVAEYLLDFQDEPAFVFGGKLG